LKIIDGLESCLQIFYISTTENICLISAYTWILPADYVLNLRMFRFAWSLCIDNHSWNDLPPHQQSRSRTAFKRWINTLNRWKRKLPSRVSCKTSAIRRPRPLRNETLNH